MIKARVKAGNSYGGAGAGSIVEVDDGEIARVPWCLEMIGDGAMARIAVIDAELEDMETKAIALYAERRRLLDGLYPNDDGSPPPSPPPTEPPAPVGDIITTATVAETTPTSPPAAVAPAEPPAAPSAEPPAPAPPAPAPAAEASTEKQSKKKKEANQ